MAGVCTAMNVPRPARGHWAKFAAGTHPPKPPLPDARPGDDVEWSVHGFDSTIPHALPAAPAGNAARRLRPACKCPACQPLIEFGRGDFEQGHVSGDGFIHCNKKLLMGCVVAKKSLSATFCLANELFLRLEDLGHQVLLAPADQHLSRVDIDFREVPRKERHFERRWSPLRSTVVFIATVIIDLTLFEMTEEADAIFVNTKMVRLADAPASRMPSAERP